MWPDGKTSAEHWEEKLHSLESTLPVGTCLPGPDWWAPFPEEPLAASALAASSRLLCCLASCSTISANRTRWSCSWPSIFCHFFPSVWAMERNSFDAWKLFATSFYGSVRRSWHRLHRVNNDSWVIMGWFHLLRNHAHDIHSKHWL